MSMDYYSRIETGDEIPKGPHAYNEFLQDRFCSKAWRARICGRQVFVEPQLAPPIKSISLERPQSQSVRRVFEATALLSIEFDMQFSIIMA